MILITGAGGKTGRAVVSKLADRGTAVRVLVRREEQFRELQAVGAVEVSVGDMTVLKDVQTAAAGIEAIYHIPPNMHPAEVLIGQQVVQAARMAGVRRVVYHSVLHPQTRRMPHHWNKLLVEERLFESGLEIAILQPTAYMQNILAGWGTIVKSGRYRVPYPPDTRLSLVDLEDVADAAARVLLSDQFSFGSYELAGTKPVSQIAVAAALENALGRGVQVEQIPLADWEQGARDSGALSSSAISTLIAMFRYYADYGLAGSPFTLTAILGRPPTSLADFLERQVASLPV